MEECRGLTMTGYFERSLRAAWCGLPRSNQCVSRSMLSAPRTAIRVMRAAMKMTVKMEPAAALRVATIRDASAFSNGVVSSLCAIFFATNYALASNGRVRRVQEAGRFGLWYDRARSMVTTTRTSDPRGFENGLDSDESWLGLTRNRGGTREASILSWTRFHPSGPQRNAAQRNATYWKPVEYVVYEQ